jgi:DNA-binding beta-propeller fold protein YncE
LGGLERVQLTRLFQWFAGFVIAAVVIYAIVRLIPAGGWTQFRVILSLVIFAGLAFLTFRSAWMASYINYDLPTEYLVYAHSGPANKRVTDEIAELSQRINGDMSLRFAYDFKFSWPGSWYVRNFTNWRYLGENPSPPDMNDSVVVIVGDENRATVETALEDRYYKFEYQRMWWPMQDYYGLTPQRVINTFDFTNADSAKIREGIWDIWWSRDYKVYGEALQRDFSLTKWPLMDHMYVFVRKDIAAQVWNLGVGNGTAANPFAATEINQCNANWQSVQANLLIQSSDVPMNYPRQVAVGQDGRIYTADEFNHRIMVFNTDGTFSFNFGQFGQLYQEGDPFYGKPNGAETGGIFNRPNGVAIGPSGNIYVADTWNYRVQVFTPDGKFITSWGQPGQFGPNAPVEPLDGFWGPRAIVVDKEERVYVADTGNKRIRVYTSTGAYLRDIGSSGSSIGQLEEPSGLVLSPEGLLYVADTWNRRISVFTTDGIPVTTFQGQDGAAANSFRVRGWVDDQGNRPYVALDPTRKLIYVTDPDAGRVLVYGTDGNCIGSFGQLGREGLSLNQFATVGGITTDAQGNVFVVDAGSGRILRFAPFAAPPAAPADAIGQQAEVTAELTAEVTPEATAPVSG